MNEEDTPIMTPQFNPNDENQRLMNALREWRSVVSKEHDIPAFWVMPNRCMADIADRRPRTEADLEDIPSFGRARKGKYGEDILRIVLEVIGEAPVLHSISLTEDQLLQTYRALHDRIEITHNNPRAGWTDEDRAGCVAWCEESIQRIAQYFRANNIDF